MVYKFQDICPTLFGWKVNILYKWHIVHWWTSWWCRCCWWWWWWWRSGWYWWCPLRKAGWRVGVQIDAGFQFDLLLPNQIICDIVALVIMVMIWWSLPYQSNVIVVAIPIVVGVQYYFRNRENLPDKVLLVCLHDQERQKYEKQIHLSSSLTVVLSCRPMTRLKSSSVLSILPEASKKQCEAVTAQLSLIWKTDLLYIFKDMNPKWWKPIWRMQIPPL